MVNAFNDMDRKVMLTTAEHHDPNIPLHQNEAYMASFRDQRDEWEADLASQMDEILTESKV